MFCMSTTERENVLGTNIRRLRLAAGLTQEELSAKADATSVAMIEAGQRPNARHDTVEKIAKALGVELSELYRAPSGD